MILSNRSTVRATSAELLNKGLLTMVVAAALIPITSVSRAQAAALRAGTPVLHGQAAPSMDEAIAQIKDEGMNRSEYMKTLGYLSDVIGQRLTASPSMKHANDWTASTLSSWGLSNAHLESWGPFGQSWVLKKFSAAVSEPVYFPLMAYPKAWSPGLKKPLEASVVWVNADTEEQLSQYKGKLKGTIVLNGPIRPVTPHFTPEASRYTDAQLETMANAVAGAPRGPRRQPRPGAAGAPGAPGGIPPAFLARFRLAGAKAKFFLDEGAALLVEPSARGDDGTIFVQQATAPQPAPSAGGQPGPRVSPWDVPAPKMVPQIAVSVEQYNRMARIAQAAVPLKMQVDLQAVESNKAEMAYNTVAEIPGTDLKDQIVMLGGHMDSWHSGTGATDNGAGVACAMEAVRIIEALHLKPRRTIRIALWSGEEEGLFGSSNYVAQHFGTMGGPTRGAIFGAAVPTASGAAPKLQTKAEYDKLSVYFNLDNGTGKVRGVYLQGNDAVRPIFARWLEPFKDMGASTLTISNTGGTDHLSFDSIGLPGFQFIQDVIEYDARTHHSNQDVFDRIQEDDMKQASTIMAAFVYHAAMRDEMIPRKPAP